MAGITKIILSTVFVVLTCKTVSVQSFMLGTGGAGHMMFGGDSFELPDYMVNNIVANSLGMGGIGGLNPMMNSLNSFGFNRFSSNTLLQIPQLGIPQFGTPQFGIPQFGIPQFGIPQFGIPQLGLSQLGFGLNQFSPFGGMGLGQLLLQDSLM